MRYKHHVLSVVVLSVAAAFAFHFILASREDESKKVITTTSVLSSVVEEIAGGKLRTATLVPAGSCPGHFDIKVHHLRLIEDGGILLAHGFEEYLPDIERAVSRNGFSPSVVHLDGSWLTLHGMTTLYEQVTDRLAGIFPEYETHFRSRLQKARLNIEETERELESIAEQSGFARVNILCNSHLAGFLESLGFQVAATYGRSEDLSPGNIKNIIETGRRERAGLVIDNMQAGADTGRVFADALEVPHVAVSNFPSVLPDTDTLYNTLRRNVSIIKMALEAD